MAQFEVRIAPRAQAQLDEIAAWWKANRQASSTLPLDEFEAAVLRPSNAAGSGAGYRQIDARFVRRLLLPRCRYHVYYETDELHSLVNVLAIWHASRRGGRGLRPQQNRQGDTGSGAQPPASTSTVTPSRAPPPREPDPGPLCCSVPPVRPSD